MSLLQCEKKEVNAAGERRGVVSGPGSTSPPAHPPARAQQGRHRRVNECPSFTHAGDPCVRDTDILCHLAGMRRLNHLPHRASHRQSPALWLEKHQDTWSHQTRPEAKLAEEFLKWLLDSASHKYKGKACKSGIVGLKGAGKAEGLWSAGTAPGTCWVSFLPTLRFGNG